ncbi:hypothetical protein ElyMa_001355100 [Elysia marginata]|uniref:SCP domain-containing protein n=1 Tax=Elysia marginata TaxID=1093978 RepID=A0AAV4INL9_9GAST|nr:hypothetical protein ElyMa_001355100 [Elysia marginata]
MTTNILSEVEINCRRTARTPDSGEADEDKSVAAQGYIHAVDNGKGYTRPLAGEDRAHLQWQHNRDAALYAYERGDVSCDPGETFASPRACHADHTPYTEIAVGKPGEGGNETYRHPGVGQNTKQIGHSQCEVADVY